MTNKAWPILGGKPKRFTVALVTETGFDRRAGFDTEDAAVEYAQTWTRDGWRCLISDWETSVSRTIA